ncbi:MAG: hypothetical protein AAFN08_07360 [Cyanobacteria bacterium J06559_3]
MIVSMLVEATTLSTVVMVTTRLMVAVVTILLTAVKATTSSGLGEVMTLSTGAGLTT